MAAAPLEPSGFTVESAGVDLAGEAVGEGPPVVLLHGITATRRYLVHGSNALPRRGYEQISYDARGHGDSSPAPEGAGFTSEGLAADLGRILEERCAGRLPVLAGHSMGAHTLATYALDHAAELAAIVPIGPATIGGPPPQEALDGWDRLADGLDAGGVDGFMEVYERELQVDPDWKRTILRFTRERMERHRHPEAVARAMREVPRSPPFEGLVELESLRLPALVVASRDDADPGHPHAVAEAWAERLPEARLIGEETGEAPLAWQGGKLARAIAEFCEEPAVRERLGGR
ncbi:MAG: alpha/beta fold hydrolase [Solirubrobacterales bacterium]